MKSEAQININGVDLTVAQSMTIRVACNHLAFSLKDGHFAEMLGPLAIAYQQKLTEIIHLLTKDPL